MVAEQWWVMGLIEGKLCEWEIVGDGGRGAGGGSRAAVGSWASLEVSHMGRRQQSSGGSLRRQVTGKRWWQNLVPLWRHVVQVC